MIRNSLVTHTCPKCHCTTEVPVYYDFAADVAMQKHKKYVTDWETEFLEFYEEYYKVNAFLRAQYGKNKKNNKIELSHILNSIKNAYPKLFNTPLTGLKGYLEVIDDQLWIITAQEKRYAHYPMAKKYNGPPGTRFIQCSICNNETRFNDYPEFITTK